MPSALFKWASMFRPTGGVTDADVKNVMRWVDRDVKSGRITGGFIACEVVDEVPESRHLHMGFEFNKGTYKCSFVKSFITAIRPRTLTADEYAQFTNKKALHSWYNEDYYTNYCAKTFIDNDVQSWSSQCIWFLEWDHENYPPPDDQSQKRPLNPWYADRTKDYLSLQFPTEATEQTCLQLLNRLMYTDKTIVVIDDLTRLKRKCMALAKYINGHADSKTYSISIQLEPNMENLLLGFCSNCFKKVTANIN